MYLAKKNFTSPREEALEIAYNTRKNIMQGKGDPVSIRNAILNYFNVVLLRSGNPRAAEVLLYFRDDDLRSTRMPGLTLACYSASM